LLLCVALSAAHGVHAANADVDLATMWRQLKSHCCAGRCVAHSGAKEQTANSTDCHGRMLTYEYALTKLTKRAPLLATFTALELHSSCGITPPTATPAPVFVALPAGAGAGSFYVDYASGSDSASGNASSPFKTVHKALAATRAGGAKTRTWELM